MPKMPKVEKEKKTVDSLAAGRWGGQFDRKRNLLASQKDHPVVTPAEAGVQNT
jgi:hypothetical protein